MSLRCSEWHRFYADAAISSCRCVLDAGHVGEHEDRRGRTWGQDDDPAQPAPTPNNEPRVLDLVLADLKARAEAGREKYGTYLQPNNGRDALRDAYEEALDLAMYLRQKIEEDKDA